MTAALALACYAAVVGSVAPKALARSAWPHRAPALAVAVWHGLVLSFTIALALTTYHLVTPTWHLHSGMSGLLRFCGLTPDARIPGTGPVGVPAIAAPASVALIALAFFGHEVLRARRVRARHRSVLDLVGRRSARLRATVLDHDTPAAYCLPGRRPRIVVSAGALRLLSPAQLESVLEHERAHIAGRHHLALAATEAFARAFRWLPLAREARAQTALLLEMAADDRALRRHPRQALVSALCAMAASQAPHAPGGAFTVGGPGAVVRLRRMLDARRRPHPALCGVLAAVAVGLPLLPPLLGCTPGM
ncbi:M56 family metallopeptidase [Streptomyces asiaticus]|uniref:M56 family metallopeptidase n=3 Tax=Streptomyces TaxID=1883 RepID=A0ABN1RFS7_9ACTN